MFRQDGMCHLKMAFTVNTAKHYNSLLSLQKSRKRGTERNERKYETGEGEGNKKHEREMDPQLWVVAYQFTSSDPPVSAVVITLWKPLSLA